ncbi:MAG: 4'-phosphopantetheinyl transferase superfamily protein [Oscillospiraceae bacterium]|nr:4'-phosphopantetheinyl transferase superfamily protein [Oscillospiraceae bacterium]
MDIIVVKTDGAVWAELSGFLGCLDSTRRAAINRKANDSDKINSLVSRLLLLSEIKRRTGIPERKIKLSLGSFGKPFLKNSALQFSLSHTRGAVCAAFGEDGEIGIDIERRDRRVNERMYARALCGEEREKARSDEDFIRFWVKKEAFLKRLGVGITRDLRGVNSLELPDTNALEFGGFFVGASGKGDINVAELLLNELLDRFILLNN